MKIITSVLPALIFLAGLWVAPKPVEAQEFQIPMTAEFIDGEVNFTGGVGRVYQYRWYLVPVEGRMALCGSGYLRDSRLRGTINDMLRDTVLVMSNQRVEVDARFFTRVRSARRLSQDNATCRPTNLPLLTGGGGTVYLEFGDAVWRN